MVQAVDVQLAAAVPTENCLGLARYASETTPSYAIALTPAAADVERLVQRLRNAVVPIVGRRVDGRLVLDLRTVLPRQDQRLVEMVADDASSLAKTVAETAAIPGV
jgi:L-seryl-tRNA(Ser) seleniumtransferase